jgi:hypothetical protein
MRNHEVYSGYLALQRIARVQLNDAAVRNRLLTTRRLLRPVAQALEEEQNAILARYGDDDRIACGRELNALLSAPVEDAPTLPEPVELEAVEVDGFVLSVADLETLVALGIVTEPSENGK